MQPFDLLIPLVLILVTARLAGMMSRRVGLPAVMGELLAGLILGRSVLGVVQVNETLETVAYLGVLILMFIAGLETDLVQMRQVSKASTTTAVGGVVLPFLAGLGLGHAIGLTPAASMFLGVALTATSVSVSVQVLQEARRLRTRSGMVMLGAAVTDDILGLLVLSAVLSFTGEGGSIGLTLLRLALFFPAAILLGRFVLGPLVHWIARLHTREAGVALIIAVILSFAWAAEALGGLAAITGAYVAGVLIGRLPEAREWVTDGVSVLGHGLFIPVFFVMVGVSTNLREIAVAPVFAFTLIAAAVLTKLVGAALGARLGGCTQAESRIIGAGMIARGEVALVVATLGLSNGIISSPLFTVIVVMAVVTTLVTPVLLKLFIAPAGVELPAPAYAVVPVEGDVFETAL